MKTPSDERYEDDPDLDLVKYSSCCYVRMNSLGYHDELGICPACHDHCGVIYDEVDD